MTDMIRTTKSIDRRNSLMTCLKSLIVAAVILSGITAGAPHALAQSLDAARSSGMVGERFDGYAVARDNATPAVRTLVTNVNSQRRKIYANRAREQNISVDAVGKLYASQIVAKAPKGTWIQLQSGAWQRK